MANDENNIYVIKSGRVSKQKFKLNISPNRRQTKKMPAIPRDGDIMTTSSSSQIGSMEAEWERLRTERRELEQMRAAYEAEKNRDQQRIDRDEAGQGQTNEHNVIEQVAAVMSNVQQIHIDIKIPKFKDETDKHPMEFINELEKYLKTKKT